MNDATSIIVGSGSEERECVAIVTNTISGRIQVVQNWNGIFIT